MSNIADAIAQKENCISKPCNGIELLIQPQEKDLGEFSVRRSLPVSDRKKVGPWIFFDHMGPAKFTAGQGVNVRPHPHINIATVTYLFEGEILHRDSLGYVQAIQPGDINLMVTGSGMVHSERERPEIHSSNHSLHGLQLWMALPEKYEEIDPAFYHYPSASIPHTVINNVPVRVLIGTAYSVTSPVKTYAETLYIEAHLSKGQTIDIPNAEERAVYVASGSVKINGTLISEYTMVVLTHMPNINVIACEDTRLAVIGGEKISERYLEWNFVSSRKDRIEQAKEEWKAQQFPMIPDDDKEFIPFPG